MRRFLALLLTATAAVAAPHRVASTDGSFELAVDDSGRLVAFGPPGASLTVGQPFAAAVKGGQRRAVTAVTDLPTGWRLAFGDGLAAELRLEPRPGGVVVRLARVEGAPEELTFVDLALQPGGESGPAGLLRYPDRVAGLVVANERAQARSGAGREACRAAAIGTADLGYEGLAAWLFCVPPARAEEAVAAAEREFGIPLGIAAKRGEANRGSYLMISGVTQQNADAVVDWAKRGGFGSVLLIHGTWGDFAHHYAVPRANFPDGLAGLKQVVDKFHAAGVLVGAHCFASKVPKSADRVHPVPDKRLYQDLATRLTAPVDAAATELPVADDLTAWPRPVGTRDLLIDDEIIVYESPSPGAPWSFRNCRRGAYGTTPARHAVGARVTHLFTDESRGIFVIDQRTDLLDEHAAEIAATYNGAGFDWIYFDGAEDVPPPFGVSVSRAKLAVLRKLARPPVTVESAAQGPFCWHLDTRTGQRDYYWISPSPKDEVDDAVERAVPAARRQFMVPNVGWFPISGPRGGRGGRGWTPLDDIEYVFGRAAATDSVVSVLCSVEGLQAHPHWDAALEIIRRYERLRRERKLDPAARELLLKPHRDAMLVVDAKGGEHVVPAREVPFVANWGDAARAIMAQAVDGEVTTELFNVGRPVSLEISLDPRRVRFLGHAWQPLSIEERPGARVAIPLRDRVLMVTRGISPSEVQMALRSGHVEPLPVAATWLWPEEAKLAANLALVDPREAGASGPHLGKALVPTAAAATPPTAAATWRVTVAKAGRYELSARVWSADTNSNSFWLLLPGREPQVLGNVMSDYESWLWTPPLTVELPAGTTELSVAVREAEPKQSPLLSALCLAPEGQGWAPTDAEARAARKP